MANVKIKDLPSAGTIQTTDVIIVDQTSQTSQSTVSKFITDTGLAKLTDFSVTTGATKVGTSSGNNVQVELNNKANTADLASTSSGKGASLIGLNSIGNVQQAINWVTPIMFGSPADGINDDSAYFQSAINSSSYVYVSDGNYILDCNVINLKSNLWIKFSKNANVTIKNTSGTNGAGYAAKVFTAVGSSSANVSNIIIQGGNFTYSDDTIAVFGIGSYVSQVWIEKVKCYGSRLIDVSDSLASSYTDSTKATRPNNIKITDCYSQMLVITSKGPGINFRLVEECSTFKNIVLGYQYGIQWSGGDAATWTDLTYERKCKNLRLDSDYVTAKYAGIWGSVGEDIHVINAHVESTTTTASDVGIDFEGCVNSSATDCYVYGFTNGNLATYFINNGIVFTNCKSVAPAGCRAARINNSLQIPTNTNIKFKDCSFIGSGQVTKVAQAGAVDRLYIENCVFEDCYLAMASNNNGSLFVKDNTLRFTMTPTDVADENHNIYAAIFLAYANNNERLIVIKNNTIYSSVSWTGLTTNSAICVVSNNFNNYTRVEIIGGGTYSTSWTTDISLYNGSSNTGITIGYLIKDFIFANKSCVVSIVDSATLYPVGSISGKTTNYTNFPASVTDNVGYANCYYSRAQKFFTNTPSAGTFSEQVVTTSGLGSACVVKNLILTT